MKHTAIMAIVSASILFGTPARAGGQQPPTPAERLGYARDAKLLIVHADDIGVARSVNVATERAFESGAITSGSVMVPAPWFADFAAYYRDHPGLDVGIHITVTAEWENYKWGGVSPAGEIPSLLDEYGHFYATEEAVAQHAVPAEVEREVRAQIQRAMALGLKPTHLDTHMGCMLFIPQLVPIYLALGKEYNLPLLVPRVWLQSVPEDQRDAIAADYVLLDGVYMMEHRDSTKSWPQQYAELLATIGPGLNELIVHLARDDDEMQAVTVDHPDYGAAWRQRDLDFVTSQAFRDLLKGHDITLVSWDQIRRVMPHHTSR
jgi:predicted glycoside hydrolase/deacetylase ChbG (UPF0249 family)